MKNASGRTRQVAVGLVACLGLGGCWPWQQQVVTGASQPGASQPGTERPQPPPPPEPEPKPEIIDPPPPLPPPSGDYPVARKVPGRDRLVFSPYNNQLISIEGLASGSLAADPNFPPEEKKYFRVP
jgi:hypothetical protein